MPERKPAPNGTLDPRLVRDSEECMHEHNAESCGSLLCMISMARRLLVLISGPSTMQGVSNKQSICQTCGQKLQDCTGHFGMLSCCCISLHTESPACIAIQALQ